MAASPTSKSDQKATLDIAAWMFNIVTSVGIIIVNKALMATYGFTFATTLTGLHFATTTLMTVVLRWLGYIQPSHLPVSDLLKFVLFGNFSIVGMNVSLMWNSVGCYQDTKLSITISLKSGIIWAASIEMAPQPEREAKSKEACNKCNKDPNVLAAIAKLFWEDGKVEKAKMRLDRVATMHRILEISGLCITGSNLSTGPMKARNMCCRDALLRDASMGRSGRWCPRL